jgi:hypothetical protein
MKKIFISLLQFLVLFLSSSILLTIPGICETLCTSKLSRGSLVYMCNEVIPTTTISFKEKSRNA